jgi:hypothetical protein
MIVSKVENKMVEIVPVAVDVHGQVVLIEDGVVVISG